jgi:hypothetical protein
MYRHCGLQFNVKLLLIVLVISISVILDHASFYLHAENFSYHDIINIYEGTYIKEAIFSNFVRNTSILGDSPWLS